MKKRFALDIALVLGLGIATSVAMGWMSWRSDTSAVAAQFHDEVAERAGLLDRQLVLDLGVLHSLKVLYDTSEDVSRQDFSTVAMGILKRHPNVQALEWIPKVPHEERPAYETSARSDGYRDFQITQRASQGQMIQAEVRPHYFPVYFVEPLVGNELAVGFDLASSSTRLHALVDSQNSGRLLATASITLVQETGDQKGFLGLLPIYDGAPTSATERTRLLRGFVLGVFRIGDIFQSASPRKLPGDRGHVAISLIDESAGAGNAVLHRQSLTDDSRLVHQFSYRKALKDVAGRHWAIVATPTGDYISAQRSWAPLIALLVGLTFTALLSVYLRLISTRTAQVERLVERRTNELQEANTALEKYTIDLEHSNRELQSFAHVASHDLQEPLRKVQMFGDRLMERCSGELSEQGQDYVARMHSATSRMQTLIDDLLAFSRVTTKNQSLEVVDLARIAKLVLSDLETRIEQTGGTVHVNDLPTIHADRTQMHQLLQNLIGNALKFHRPGQPPIVKVHGSILNGKGGNGVQDMDGQAVFELTVQDNGIGFEEKYRDRIFTIFQRLHGRSAYEGTGVGLAVCRKVAERHGGDISVNSVPSQGSTFVVRLPISHSAEEEM